MMRMGFLGTAAEQHRLGKRMHFDTAGQAGKRIADSRSPNVLSQCSLLLRQHLQGSVCKPQARCSILSSFAGLPQSPTPRAHSQIITRSDLQEVEGLDEAAVGDVHGGLALLLQEGAQVRQQVQHLHRHLHPPERF